MSSGNTFVEELKWIKRELNNLKAARPVNARATTYAATTAPETRVGKVVTQSAEVSVPGELKDSQFTIEITPVTAENDAKEKSEATIRVTVQGMRDFSLDIVKSEE